MLTEYAVLASVTPICSAIAMNRLLKISSITGSTCVPSATRGGRGALRVSSRWASGVTCACHCGSTIVVALASAMIAGPAITSPGRNVSRR